MKISIGPCACLMVCTCDALEASVDDRHCWVDFTDEEVRLQREGNSVLGLYESATGQNWE